MKLPSGKVAIKAGLAVLALFLILSLCYFAYRFLYGTESTTAVAVLQCDDFSLILENRYGKGGLRHMNTGSSYSNALYYVDGIEKRHVDSLDANAGKQFPSFLKPEYFKWFIPFENHSTGAFSTIPPQYWHIWVRSSGDNSFTLSEYEKMRDCIQAQYAELNSGVAQVIELKRTLASISYIPEEFSSADSRTRPYVDTFFCPDSTSITIDRTSGVVNWNNYRPIAFIGARGQLVEDIWWENDREEAQLRLNSIKECKNDKAQNIKEIFTDWSTLHLKDFPLLEKTA